jgi:hypothetical protein
MSEPDKYLVLLRRELTRAQARLARAERERDRALADNASLRQKLSERRAASLKQPTRK